jgi:hypothetical protein
LQGLEGLLGHAVLTTRTVVNIVASSSSIRGFWTPSFIDSLLIVLKTESSVL